MDLNQIAIFVHVIDAGSLSKAAQRLKQPKSRISRWIKALEADLGTTLIYRSTRQLSLTDAGEKIYKESRKRIYELEGLYKSATIESKEISGKLRITAPEDFGTFMLPSILSELFKLYPKLSTDIILSNRERNLISEGIDLAIHIGKLNDSEMKSLHIGHLRFIVVVGTKYLDSAPPLKTTRDLTHHKILWFSLGDETERWKLLKGEDGPLKNIELEVFHRSNNSRLILEMALRGDGVALLPEFICKDHLEKGELIRVLEDYESAKAPVSFIWPSQKELNLKTREFIKVAQKKLGGYFIK